MFTDEELEGAVLRYLTSDVRTERTEAGTRDVVAAKAQVYEIISAAFLLRPSALFSVCWMASNNLRAKLLEQLLDMQAILDAAPHVSKSSQRVDSTTDLYNAEASLVTLTAAFSARSAGVAGGIGPAIQRFGTSVERFIRAELAKNTIAEGAIVKTPEELRVEVAARWRAASERHPEILEAVEQLASALDNYNGVRLPDTVVGTLLARIQGRLGLVTAQMQAPSAAQDSRSALLELSAMRTLLRQAAQFRPPVLQKMPVTGDAPTGVLLGDTGSPASILGTVSGPFNYAPGTELAYSVAGAATTLTLPRTSAAELRSRAISPYTDPPEDAECAFAVGLTTTAVLAAAWGSGAAAAAALDALVGVGVTWDGVTSQLVFRTDSFADGSSLVLLEDTPARSAFVGWCLTAGVARRVMGAPVPAEEVALAFAADARLRVRTVREVGEAFTGQRSPTPGEEDVLQHRVAAGADLVGDDGRTARANVDLEALGVVPGMYLVTTAPTPHTLRIDAVAGPQLALEAPLAAGTYTYFIGPDLAVLEPGSRVNLTGTADAGSYRVVEGEVAELRLDRPLTAAGAAQVTSVTSELLVVELREPGPAATLEVIASAGATALGLPLGTAAPKLDTFDVGIDAGVRGVQAGDRLVLQPEVGAPSTHTVVSISGTTVRFAPAKVYQAGLLRYVLRDARVQDYLALSEQLRLVQQDVFLTDSATLDQIVGRLTRGARYTGQLVVVLSGYVAALRALLELCDGYVVPRDPTVEQALRVMVEHGFDRAADMFVALRLAEFFALEADGVSYKTWAMRTALEVGRLVVPVSRDTRDPTSQWRTLAVQRADNGGR